MVINSVLRPEGEFYIEHLGPDMKVKGVQHVRNLIVNDGLNAMLSTSPTYLIPDVVQVGTGSTSPSYTDTQLGSLLDSIGINPNVPYSTSSLTDKWWQTTVTFGASQAVGTIREIGTATSDPGTGRKLWSRTVLDSPIVKLNGDYLVVTYRLSWNVGSLSSYTVTDNHSNVWNIKSIVSRDGVYEVGRSTYRFSSTAWNRVVYGANNTTDPAETNTGVLSSAQTISANTVTITPHFGPTDGFYCDIAQTFNASNGTGTWKELWTTGSGYSNRNFCARYTINDGSGGGLVKGASDVVTITYRITLSR